MSDEHISRPEFNLYVKMNSESNQRTSKALEKMASDNKAIYDQVLGYFHKHDRIEEQVNKNTKTITEISEAVEANSRLTSAANKLTRFE